MEQEIIDHLSSLGINNTNLPQFARLILNSEYNVIEKIKFINVVLLPYLTNEQIRRQWQDQYVFFVNDQLFAVAKHRSEIVPDDYPGCYIERVLISDNPPKYYLLMAKYVETIEINNGLPKTNIHFHYNGDTTSEYRLLDTGATYTGIPGVKFWDSTTKLYVNSSNIPGRYDFNYFSLNSNIADKIRTELDTANGLVGYWLIVWKTPLVISLANLPVLNVNQMIAPMNNNCAIDVIGFDILSKYNFLKFDLNNKSYLQILTSNNCGEDKPGVSAPKSFTLGFRNLLGMDLAISKNLERRDKIILSYRSDSDETSKEKFKKFIQAVELDIHNVELTIKQVNYYNSECVKFPEDYVGIFVNDELINWNIFSEDYNISMQAFK